MSESIIQAINAAWPAGSQPAPANVKRSAALHLAAQPNHQDTISNVAAAVQQLASLPPVDCIRDAIERALQQDPCFVLEAPNDSALITLDAAAVSLAPYLHAAWPVIDSGKQGAMARVKHAAAISLYGKRNMQDSMAEIGIAISQRLGYVKKTFSAKQLGVSRFSKVLQGSTDVFMTSGSGGNTVTLDMAALVQRSQQQASMQGQPQHTLAPPPGLSPSPQQTPTSPIHLHKVELQRPFTAQGKEPVAALPLLGSLQQLNSITPMQCSAAQVIAITELQQLHGQVIEMLQHLRAAQLAALDLEFAQCTTATVALSAACGVEQGIGKYSSSMSKAAARSPQLDQLALLQLFIPEATTPAAGASRSRSSAQQLPASIYIIQVPEDASAAVQLLSLLQTALEDESIVKVMHDARQDSCVLQRQFGIGLQGVLDTQVLAGLTGLAAATQPQHATGAAVIDASSSNSSSAVYLGRVGLGRLYEHFGFPHPNKSSMCQGFEANPRLWFSRPLPPDAVDYAANDVRFLLLVAQQLLQQLPTAVICASSLQMLLAQQGSAAVQLKQQLLPGYSSFMCPQDQPGKADMAAAGEVASSSALALPGLTQLQFELILKFTSAHTGWYTSSYVVYLNDENIDAAQQVVAPCDGSKAACLADVSGSSSAVVLPGSGASKPNEFHTDGTDSQGLAGGMIVSNSSSDSLDEAVVSIAQLLPARLSAELEPYLQKSHQPQLVEVIADQNINVKLRLSDRTTHVLDYPISIKQALLGLLAARQQWVQQGREQDDVSGHSRGQLGWLSAGASSSSSGMQRRVSTSSSESVSGHATGSDQSSSSAVKNLHPERKGLLTGLFSAIRKQRCQAGCGYDAAGKLQLQHEESNWNRIVSSFSPLRRRSGFDSKAINSMFGSDNRMGVPGALHRISAMRDKQGNIYGLTYRVGRHVPGVAMLIADVLSSMKASLDPERTTERPQSLLVLGKPGVGKTTLLRDIARLMSLPAAQGGLGLAVVIVDTSNEIAGDAEECHPCIGKARRMMVPHRDQQAEVLVQAVQNHNPDVIIVDEIGNRKEVSAARTISQRGVLLIGTAHGTALDSLLRNDELRPLVGGVKDVTLGDAEAKLTNNGQKTRLERAGAATFTMLLELQTKHKWRLHLDVEHSVDTLLRSPSLANTSTYETKMAQQQRQSCSQINTQIRSRDASGRMAVQLESPAAARKALAAAAAVQAAAAGTDQNSDADAVDVPNRGPSAAGQAGFTGGWLVDLLHAAVHKTIQTAASA